MRTGPTALLFVVLALLLAAPAHAVAPVNDTAAGAFNIADGPYPVNGPLVADITDATPTGDPPTPSCQSSVTRSVWYTWTPSQTAAYQISTAADQGTGTTVDDTVLGVYTSAGGAAGPFTEVPTGPDTDGCDDDNAVSEPLQSLLRGTFTAGTTYYIVVWEFGTLAPSAGNTAVQPGIQKLPPPPPGDTAAGAPELRLDRPLDVDDTTAANDYQLAAASPCFAAGQTASTAPGRDSVYTFTAPSNGSYSFRVSTLNSVPQDLVLYLASASPGGPPPATVSCTQAFNRVTAAGTYSGEVATGVTLTSGQKIYIFVDRSAATMGGPLHLEASAEGATETEPNNTPATAGPLSCGIRGAVNPAAEADFYSLGTPSAGSRIFAMADSIGAGPSSDTDMRLNSATDTLEYDDGDLDLPFGVTNFAPVLAGAQATGANLFLQMDRFGPAPPDVADPYYVYSVVQPPSTGATPETEPDDTPGQAGAAANNYFTGALAGPPPSSDADLYGFQAHAGDLIFVALDGDPARDNTPVDATLQLLDSAGNVELTVNGSSATVQLDNANPPGPFEVFPAFPAEGFAWRSPSSGTHFVRVLPADAGATGVGDYLLSISRNCAIGGGGLSTPAITTSSLPDATVGTAYSKTVEADNTVGGAEFSIASGNLPPGLALDSAGHITGTPTDTGSFNFTVQVKDGRDLTATRALGIVVHSSAGADTTAPIVSHLRSGNRKFAPKGAPRGKSKRGTTFSFNLSEAAAVKITIARLVDGRRVKRKCVKPTRKNRKKPHCKRALKKGTLSFGGQAGSNKRAFSGKLRSRKLKPGLYQATLVATDAAGNRSKPVKVRFRVVRR